MVWSKVIPYGTEIGRLLNTKKVETGSGYEASPSPTLSLPSSIIIKDKTSGSFTEGESITGFDSSSTAISATFVSFDSARNLIVVKDATGEFLADTTITGATSEITATVMKNDLGSENSVCAVVDTGSL